MAPRGTTPLLTLLVYLTSLSSCGINPVPEPPSVEPLDPPATETITLAPDMLMSTIDVDVVGAPGSAEPGAQIWAVNIDDTKAPVLADVQADGSFALTVQGFANDEVRLQVRSGQRRSEPVDVVIPVEAGPAVLVARPLAACLSLTPASELVLPLPTGSQPPSASILIENRCGAEASITDVRLRVPTDAFALEAPDVTVPAGGSTLVTVRAYGAPGSEEILLIQIGTPDVDRRPVTLVSRGGVSGLSPTCAQVAGACLSDPMDVGFPADCEALGQQTLQATCEAFNTTCCIAAP
jgi:hypothetical protein